MSLPIYARLRSAFVDALARELGTPAEELALQVKPAEPPHGDLSFPTFALAKARKKAPPAIAAELVKALAVPGLELSATGPYVNARFAPSPFTEEVIAQARAGQER